MCDFKVFYSPCLKRAFRLKVAASTVRSIDKSGGIDNFLIQCPKEHFSGFALKLRKSMEKKLHKKTKPLMTNTERSDKDKTEKKSHKRTKV